MKWSNERAIEFLQTLETEPCLWDPRLQSFKNRSAQSDAWRRVIDALPFQVTLDELKKKKESLMGYYRIHLHKYKKSLGAGNGADDVYTTNWFAFDTMDAFLRPIYIDNSMMNVEASLEESDNENVICFKQDMDSEAAAKNSTRASTESSSNNECLSTSVTREVKMQTRPYIQCKKLTTPPVSVKAEKETNETIECFESTTNKRKELDEYDYFAGLIACKIRKLKSMDDREELMNEIQNLTYRFYRQRRQT